MEFNSAFKGLMLSEFNVASYQVHLISPISSLLHEIYIILFYVMLCYVKIIIIQDCYKNLLHPEGKVSSTTSHEVPEGE
jgi:hypothetical protein